MNTSRQQVVALARRAYHEADRALDCFAADKDEEGIAQLAMARADLEEALRLWHAGQSRKVADGPAV
jgi:hypothetical protein